MPRILALDVGEKRVGVAATDSLGLTAQPLKTLDRRPHALFLAAIGSLCEERAVEVVVLGLPRRTDGRLGPEAQKVLSLAFELRSRLGLNVVTWEEWLTTVEAERLLIEAGLKREQRRKVIDQTAATLILESYLKGQDSQAQGAL
ncbi:MAG: Holliday junction resolvase RuvX [Deltaproteobacteria bacterium]|nr:Holliday junction resolvase RuvX [Deltaproteobacteria bacterium]